MKIARQIDLIVAEDMQLDLRDIPVVLKHVHKLHRIVTGFVFAYHKDGLTYYDTVQVLRECNGLRIRIPRFAITSAVKQRIVKHQYQRWYVQCGDALYPLQPAKPVTLFESFYFVVSDDPRYRTQTAFTGETQFIRKKALVACRPVSPGWGVRVQHRKLLEAV